MALDILTAYRARLQVTPPPDAIGAELNPALTQALRDYDAKYAVPTPISPSEIPPDPARILHALAEGRRSVRAFTGEPVDFSIVERAARAAQLSPSAVPATGSHGASISSRIARRSTPYCVCRTAIAALAKPFLCWLSSPPIAVRSSEWSNGSSPFWIPACSCHPSCWPFRPTACPPCCLNWCVPPDHDAKAHKIRSIPDSQQIMTFLAIGKAAAEVRVPCSHRRPLQDCLIRHRKAQEFIA